MKNKIFLKKVSLTLLFSFLTNIAQPIMCASKEIKNKESKTNKTTNINNTGNALPANPVEVSQARICPTENLIPDKNLIPTENQISSENPATDKDQTLEEDQMSDKETISDEDAISDENQIQDENFDPNLYYEIVDPATINAVNQQESTKLPFAFEETNLEEDLAEIILKSAPQEVKTLIKNHESRANKIKPYPIPKQIILYGPCGTGKSDIGRLIANKFGKKGLIVRCSLLGSEWQNSEQANLTRAVNNAIEQVKQYCGDGSSVVIILEEIDSLLKENNKKQPGDASMASLLDGLMKMPAILVFTTNDISCISSRFKDRCCYQKMIEVPRPDPNVQIKIINYYINKANSEMQKNGFPDFKINELSIDLTKILKSRDFSIRMLKALFDNALSEALDRSNSKKITLRSSDFKISNEQMIKSTKKIEYEQFKKDLIKFIEKYGSTIIGVIGIIGSTISILIQIRAYKLQVLATRIQVSSLYIQGGAAISKSINGLLRSLK